mmetsp:Transcript_39391/g.59570  ORF Transcript_39391/g.59570 Transcript_39391/m.59570 type:complete len:110 (+) Transcript_39391:182-511(+)
MSAEKKYDYDLLVIGGGSGGSGAAKRAVSHGAKVASKLLYLVKCRTVYLPVNVSSVFKSNLYHSFRCVCVYVFYEYFQSLSQPDQVEPASMLVVYQKKSCGPLPPSPIL